MGVGRSTVLRYESGERSPDADYLADLSEKFGVGLDWLVTGAGPMRPSDLPPLRPTTLDPGVLHEAIAILDEVLAEFRLLMTSEQRADVIRHHYELLMVASDAEKRREAAENLKSILRLHLKG